MIQLTRSGLTCPSPDEIDRLNAEFARHHAVRLPGFLEPTLLGQVAQAVAVARFSERVHAHLKPPTTDLGLDDPGALGRLLVLFNDGGLFRFIEGMTGCDRIGMFQGTVYKMLPGIHHLDSWHDDNGQGRLTAMTLNLSPDGFAGGLLQVRAGEPPGVVYDVANTGFGDAIVFRVADGFEHRVTPVEPGPVKIAWTGWFRRAPSFHEVLRGAAGNRVAR
jgi:hypothetical protein